LGGAAGSESFRALTPATTGRYVQARGSSNNPDFGASGGTLILYGGANSGIAFFSNGYSQAQFNIAHTASAVNFVQVTGAATGGRPTISAQGSDASAGLNIYAKGGAPIFFSGNGNNIAFALSHVTAATNYLSAAPSITGSAPVFAANGTDTNVSMAFRTQGTGAINLAPGSSGVNISNGGTVTAITRTSTGSNYTSFPAVAISAPTTAGGVQATAQVQRLGAGSTLSGGSGGTGYTVGNVLTVVGGTPASFAATYTVTGVSGGAVTAVTPLNFADYTVLPTNPVSVTGGTGTGATLNIGWYVSFGQPVITNAGSGYVEQPTVTFSGGGGSGAAAYASVGSWPTIRSLAGNNTTALDFSTAASASNGVPVLRLRDTTGDSFIQLFNGASATTLLAQGNANSNINIAANGTGNIRLVTSGGALTEQLRVAHTTSAVNFVQVTGAATGNLPTVTAQGSDTNVGLILSSKGAFNVGLRTGTNTVTQFEAAHVASAVNFLQARGAIAGAAPSFTAAGSDTNIDLALTPKGTGNVRFGTYTASMALTVQGFIEVKDSGGTIRKLAVIA
jgi:hypothetical protein